MAYYLLDGRKIPRSMSCRIPFFSVPMNRGCGMRLREKATPNGRSIRVCSPSWMPLTDVRPPLTLNAPCCSRNPCAPRKGSLWRCAGPWPWSISPRTSPYMWMTCNCWPDAAARTPAAMASCIRNWTGIFLGRVWPGWRRISPLPSIFLRKISERWWRRSLPTSR